MIDINDRRAFVFEIQKWLYEISKDRDSVSGVFPDGIYGPETTDSVRTFQKAFGLEQSGDVDFNTWTAIYGEYLRIIELKEKAYPLRPFDTALEGDKVKEGDISILVQIIQIILLTLSVYYDSFPSIVIDGKYDGNTRDAVLIFQEKNGLTVTGEVDKLTWNKLAEQFNEIIKYSN
ncbi:MAG: peptidoglycan-binding protein [Ruminococcaceae bacterium]|nr:peptidoglycan-binding protein [Oscillospiraceae bacterium]